jgi:hypothetical protein
MLKAQERPGCAEFIKKISPENTFFFLSAMTTFCEVSRIILVGDHNEDLCNAEFVKFRKDTVFESATAETN